MRLLLDTQIYLWILDDSPRLNQRARDLILAAIDSKRTVEPRRQFSE